MSFVVKLIVGMMILFIIPTAVVVLLAAFVNLDAEVFNPFLWAREGRMASAIHFAIALGYTLIAAIQD